MTTETETTNINPYTKKPWFTNSIRPDNRTYQDNTGNILYNPI